ncbi:MAG: HAMP domain-containing sensor histidine kinase [Bacteroidota bacterium]
MRLSRNTVRALITLMVFGLVGLVVLQYRLLQSAAELKEQTFKRNVYAALNSATDKLEEIDARNTIFTVGDSTAALSRQPLMVAGNEERTFKKKDTTFSVTVMTTSSPSLTTKLTGEQLSYTLHQPQRVSIRILNALGRLDTTLVDVVKGEGEHHLVVPKERFDEGPFFIQIKTDSGNATYRWLGKNTSAFSYDVRDPRKEKIFRRIFETVAPGRPTQISRRVSCELLDSLLKTGLENNGVALPYEFAVGDIKLDSIVVGRSAITRFAEFPRDYARPVFANDFTSPPGVLAVRFPTYRTFLLGALLPELGSSFLLLALIVFCFWYTVRVILRQKEFAGRMSEFINNMTHEFKTPISTIGLAGEAMTRPDVLRSKAKMTQYKDIISYENTRMKNQVDRILQMALLEEGNVEFDRKPVEMHSVINNAIENFTLQVAAREGDVTAELNARQTVVEGDRVHLENVIRNVLDNAAKYSPSAPSIRVESTNKSGEFIVRVTDDGMGISEENLGKVFDKYYRVPSGNVHDVKGFGLGLSYVKLIMKSVGGDARIESHLGKGTTVELRFPVGK